MYPLGEHVQKISGITSTKLATSGVPISSLGAWIRRAFLPVVWHHYATSV
jgi:hypothetical protein